MKSQTKKQAFENLKTKGMRVTKIRQKLIEFILSQAGHWTIQGLASKVKKNIPGIGIATVYRTVNLLVEEGALTKTVVSQGPARYEVTPEEHHDHLTCLDCGKIVEFENNQIEKLQEKIARDAGFTLVDHQMELFGECLNQKCPNRKASKKNRTSKRSSK